MRPRGALNNCKTHQMLPARQFSSLLSPFFAKASDTSLCALLLRLALQAIRSSVHTALLPESFRRQLLDTLFASQPQAIKPGSQSGNSQARDAPGDTNSNIGGGSGSIGIESSSSSNSTLCASRRTALRRGDGGAEQQIPNSHQHEEQRGGRARCC